MKLAGVLFDLDGTLIDTAPDFIEVSHQLCREYQLCPKNAAEIRAQVSEGATAMTALSFDTAPDDARFNDLLAQFLQRYGEIAGSHSSLFEQADAALTWLELRGIPWGIVTNKPRRFTEPLLERMHLAERCASVVCPDDVSQRKPHPEPLLLACMQLQVRPEHCLYLGDHQRDIEAAQAAKMPAVACRWGYLTKPDDADQWNAEFIVGNTNDLLNLFENTYV